MDVAGRRTVQADPRGDLFRAGSAARRTGSQSTQHSSNLYSRQAAFVISSPHLANRFHVSASSADSGPTLWERCSISSSWLLGPQPQSLVPRRARRFERLGEAGSVSISRISWQPSQSSRIGYRCRRQRNTRLLACSASIPSTVLAEVPAFGAAVPASTGIALSTNMGMVFLLWTGADFLFRTTMLRSRYFRSGAGRRVVSGCLKGRGRSISRALNAKTD